MNTFAKKTPVIPERVLAAAKRKEIMHTEASPPASLPLQYHIAWRAWKSNPPALLEHIQAMDLYMMTLQVFGSGAWSDTHLAEVLAWGQATNFMECCVLNRPLNSVIMVASFRFGIRGGCMPDLEAMEKLLWPKLAEIKEKGVETPWLPELMARYHITGWKKMGIDTTPCVN